MQLIDDGTFVEDAWTDLSDAETLPSRAIDRDGDLDLIVSQSQAVSLDIASFATTRHGRLGVRIDSDCEPTSIEALFSCLALIVVTFAAYSDGRGFSLARNLRNRGFRGELRASGPLISDQYAFVRACGFDTVEIPEALAERQPAAQWLRAQSEIRRTYQPGYRATDCVLALRHANSHIASKTTETGDWQALDSFNEQLAGLTPQARFDWALENLPGEHVLTSSFGVQAAVCLHMATRVYPDIPVVLIDTGYLFPETYRFIDTLSERLRLNLKVFRAERSPSWQEARHGARWGQGLGGIESYNDENKVVPMRHALQELRVGTWFAGLRRGQSKERARILYVDHTDGRWKIHPIADWSDRDVHRYLNAFDLPYHPLWHQGYVSIGDQHSTRPIHEVASADETRFSGLKRECGIHEMD